MIIRCAYFSVLPGTLFFDMQPFTTGSLPSRCYVPEGWFTGLIVLFWYVSCLSTTSMPMADGLFFSFAVSLIVQFKLLRHKFKNMKLLKNQSEVKVWNELKQLVDHHNFLLRYTIINFLFFILTTLLVIAKISTQLIKDCFLGYFSQQQLLVRSQFSFSCNRKLKFIWCFNSHPKYRIIFLEGLGLTE